MLWALEDTAFLLLLLKRNQGGKIKMFKLEDAKRLTQNMLEKGVIETMEKTSGVLQRLPFIEVVGNGYSYNIMEDLPEVNYREVNKGYKNTPATVKQAVESLVIFGGDADVDVFLGKTHSNINDIRALNTEAKAKSVARTFEKEFFSGTGAAVVTSEGGNAISLKGLDARLTASESGTKITATLTLDALNELLDAVVDGADTLFMSKKMRREVMKLLQENGHYIENGTDAFGRMVQYYGGVEIVAVDDSLIPADKIYAVKFGTDSYVHGLSNGGVQVRDLGELDTLPVYRTRIEMYAGLCVKHKKAFAVLEAQGEMRTAKTK